MATGDNSRTATAIGRQMHLVDANYEKPESKHRNFLKDQLIDEHDPNATDSKIRSIVQDIEKSEVNTATMESQVIIKIL